jgi:hypothetical protein
MKEYFIYSMPEKSSFKAGIEISNQLRDLFNKSKRANPEQAEKFRRAANFASNLPKHGYYGIEINGQRKKTDPEYLRGNSKWEFRKLIVYSFIA